MDGYRYLQRVRRIARPNRALVKPSPIGLHSLLDWYVIKRFHRICNETAVVIPLNPGQPDDDDVWSDIPVHPACAPHRGRDYCMESWQLHLAAVRRRPEAHWHTCDHGMLCGLVPVVHEQRCLAAVRLVCTKSITPAKFDAYLEFITILIENFVNAESEFLRQCRDSHALDPVLRVVDKTVKSAGSSQRKPPPQVRRAIQYIERHLADSSLSVNRVASEMELHPNYLSQLFSTHTGERMSRFIVQRRMVLAINLLATTDWPVKRIAICAGFSHPNWFSHIFIEHVGCSPTAYRLGQRATG